MTIKLAYAILYYVTLSFAIFEDTSLAYLWIKGEKQIGDGFLPDDLNTAIVYQEELCTNLLRLSQEQLGFTEKDIPRYPKLLIMLNVDKLTFPILKDAAKILAKAVDMKLRDIDDVGYFLD